MTGLILLLAIAALAPGVSGQATPPADAEQVWKTLWQPAFDPAKSASVKDLTLGPDRIHITLADGTIQFAQPANGIVFGATFRGNGRVQIEPPNRMEAQQLQLFTKQNRLGFEFSEATFSFSDDTFDQVAAKVQWALSGAASDDLYVKRQQQREDLGAEFVLFKSLLSADRKRTAVFLADLKAKNGGWVEVCYDALDPEEIGVGRWVDVGPVKNFDVWMSFPAGGRSSSDAWSNPPRDSGLSH